MDKMSDDARRRWRLAARVVIIIMTLLFVLVIPFVLGASAHGLWMMFMAGWEVLK